MRKFKICMLLCALMVSFVYINAQVNFPGGRIAMSYDGNDNDQDDYGAMPIAIAMVAKAGLSDKLVHVEHGNCTCENKPNRSNKMNNLCEQAFARFGPFPNAKEFQIMGGEQNAASNNLAAEINASTASDPLWICAAGPMHTVAAGIRKAQQNKRQYVIVVSHSNWNQNYDRCSGHTDWVEMKNEFNGDGILFIESSSNTVLPNNINKLADQNRSNGQNDFNSDKSNWNWLKNHSNADYRWLFNNNTKSTYDVSDAGMTFFVITGGVNLARTQKNGCETCGSAETKALFDGTDYSVVASVGSGDGTISPSGTSLVPQNGSITYTITPAACGASIASVIVDGVDVGPQSSYTFNNVTQNHTIVANFTSCPPHYDITASVGAGDGSISPPGVSAVLEGGDITYTIAPEPCSEIVSVLVNGTDIGAQTSYTFTNVTADQSIVANFTDCPSGINITSIKTDCNAGGKARNVIYFSVSGTSATPTANRGDVIADGANWKVREVGVAYSSTLNYTITVEDKSETVSVTAVNSNCEPAVESFTIAASATGDGTITPSGNVSVTQGGSQIFEMEAGPCSALTDVLVNGVSVGAVSPYTITDVQADGTIEAVFTALPLAYTITASASACCIITPPGISSVACGESQTYTISAAAGCEIVDVIVDGVSQGAISSYTFNVVTADHTIEAICQEIPPSNITITNIVTDCNKGGKARNVIYFTVEGTSSTPSINKGTLLNDGGGAYRLRDVGVAKGSSTTYIISVDGESVSETVTAVTTCPKSAIGLTADNLEVDLYPNPVSSNLEVILAGSENANFSVMSLSGQSLTKGELQSGITSIDVSDLNAGMYILQINTNNQVIHREFIKE